MKIKADRPCIGIEVLEIMRQEILLFICTYIYMHLPRYYLRYDVLTGVMQRALCHKVLVRYKIHL